MNIEQTEHGQEQPPGLPPKPAGLSFHSDGLRIVIRSAPSRLRLVGLLFAAFPLGVLVAASQLDGPRPVEWMGLGLVALPFLTLFYWVLNKALNYLVISVERGFVTTRRKPFPPTGKRTLATAEIGQLFVRRVHVRGGRSAATDAFVLVARLRRNGQDVELGGFNDFAKADFVERALEEHLNLRDERVAGDTGLRWDPPSSAMAREVQSATVTPAHLEFVGSNPDATAPEPATRAKPTASDGDAMPEPKDTGGRGAPFDARLRADRAAFEAYYQEHLRTLTEDLEAFRQHRKTWAKRSLIAAGLVLAGIPATGVATRIILSASGAPDRSPPGLLFPVFLVAAIFLFARWNYINYAPKWPRALRRVFDGVAKFLSPHLKWVGRGPAYGGYGHEELMKGKLAAFRIRVERAVRRGSKDREIRNEGFTVSVTLPSPEAGTHFPRIDLNRRLHGGLGVLVDVLQSTATLAGAQSKYGAQPVPLDDPEMSTRFFATSPAPEHAKRFLVGEAMRTIPEIGPGESLAVEFRGNTIRARFGGSLAGRARSHFVYGPGLADPIDIEFLWSYVERIAAVVRMATTFGKAAGLTFSSEGP